MIEGTWSWGYEREIIQEEIADLEAQVEGLKGFTPGVLGCVRDSAFNRDASPGGEGGSRGCEGDYGAFGHSGDARLPAC